MFEKVRTYFADTSAEMKRVSWPTFGELKESTIVVIITVAVVTVFIFVVDQVLAVTIRKLILRT